MPDLGDTSTRLHAPGGSRISRRRVLGTAAWSAPAIVVATAAPSFATSGTPTPTVAFTSDFDGIATALPAGFTVRTGASTTNLGTAATFTSAATNWTNTGGGFFNVASATGLTGAATTAQQAASTNRAVAVRQSGSFGDPGAAFVVELGPTTGRTNVNLSFKAQQVHETTTAGRTTTWTVDAFYGTTRVVALANAFSTVQGTFKNDTVNATFGSQLDNLSSSVFVRIATVTGSANANVRPFTAIDDLTIVWT
ncbi:hypothetical protein GCM10023340_20250 [Nocardioides marinquilinus]|uniref:Uncharacterized protein n=1 Tax=Nocardioides marinquilinus TaxID=1210400 RepID=A0ABP9PLW8_9ACTN